jgi:hypothetical protein
MHSMLHRSVLCASLLSACLAIAAGCGEKDSTTQGDLDKLGADLKNAGEHVAADAKDATGKMADKAKDAGAAMNAQLDAAGESLKKLASEASAAMSQEGDQLAKTLKAKLPAIEQSLETVKTQLNARGAAFKDMVADLTSRQEGLQAAIDKLAAAGKDAGTDLKQAAVQAFTSLSTAVQDAIAKLST